LVFIGQHNDDSSVVPAVPERQPSRRWKVLLSVAVLVVAGLVAGVIYGLHRATLLTERDTILLANFTNTTGEAVFDDALKQGLAIRLERSPFLASFPNSASGRPCD